MKYIKSRSNFLNEKKHNLILEGGLQNDINWGDSLVGRLFSSAFRLGAKAINTKRLDGLGNTLRNRLLKDTLKSVTDENPELKEQLNEKAKEKAASDLCGSIHSVGNENGIEKMFLGGNN